MLSGGMCFTEFSVIILQWSYSCVESESEIMHTVIQFFHTSGTVRHHAYPCPIRYERTYTSTLYRMDVYV